ncbi:hypothetical protein HK103_001254 [Boothiomyces macroporosus]|uniref:UBA domain-containing protein n=1 Tax=Boothiomyces macroporosus TaxID=261099 RepID=A0AAD5UP78_9FUNG|nr:hypothetical protein HK103_001254 [Boothiomyces macroporosus]
MHYRDLINIPLIKPQVPATPSVLNKYQLIPDDILSQYQVDFTLENNVLKEFEGFTHYNNTLIKAKKERELYKQKLAEIKEQERIAELKKKAPGLSNDILKPSAKSSVEEIPPDPRKDKVDISEFDPGLSSADPWESQGIHDLQALKEIMTKSTQSPSRQSPNRTVNTHSTPPVDQRNTSTPPFRTNSVSPDNTQFGQTLANPAPVPGQFPSPPPQFYPPTSNQQYNNVPISRSDLPYQMQNMSLNSGYYQHAQKLPTPTQVKFDYNSPPAPPPKPDFSPDTLRRAANFPLDKQREFTQYYHENRKYHDRDAVVKSYELFGTKGKPFLENFESLSEMGFLKDKIIQALTYAKNDKNNALEYLFNN